MLAVVVEAEVKKYTVNVQEVHIAKVLVPLRDLGGPSDLGCKHLHMVQLLEAHCKKAHSSVEGSYSPSWTYMCLDFFSRVADSVVLPLGVPLGSNLYSIQHWTLVEHLL